MATINQTRAVIAILVLAATRAIAFAAQDDGSAANAAAPMFYRDVLPILEQHCQSCHRQGGIAPMPLVTYRQARAYAGSIAAMTRQKRMPPWFADPHFGKFSNDPSLTSEQIQTLQSWATTHAPAGNPRDAPPSPPRAKDWNIPQPDLVLRMPKAVSIPAKGDIAYTYEIVHTGFTEGKWVRMSEVRPSGPQHVHHAVVYIRPPDSPWLRNAPVGVPFTADVLATDEGRREAHGTDSDMLLVYAPGSSPDSWPEGMAKFVPAGSDLVFQMHYTTNGHAGQDRTSIGMVFARSAPQQRVITLQLSTHSFLIPPGADDFRVEVEGTLPNDAVLLSFLPHMHLRGKRFEYDMVNPDGSIETLLRVNYDFHWQLSYRLAEPRLLKAGTRLRAVAWYDNSANNLHNPDPARMVTWGEQTYQEMMVGFFDVAVPANMDKWQYFVRPGKSDTQH